MSRSANSTSVTVLRTDERTATTPAVIKYSYAAHPCIMELREMMTYRRPAGSQTERDFILTYLEPLEPTQDKYGNLFVKVGEDSQVIWSSHTDTVHSKDGIQRVRVDRDVAYTKDANSSCLGADCTTGVWLMIEMIKAGVPGLYIFHRDEEVGGGGSDYITDTFQDFLKDYKYAIAFDRKGTNSVITHQMVGRCCSDAFVSSIVGMLPKGYSKDQGGTFTDTANYAHLIPECSNISVGYNHQHCRTETQDLYFAFKLRNAMLKFDESQLICERDPTKKTIPAWPIGNDLSSPEWKTYLQEKYGDEYLDDEDIGIDRKNEEGIHDGPYRARSVDEFCRRNIDCVSDILLQLGYDVDQLYEEFPTAF